MNFSRKQWLTFDDNESVSDEVILNHLTKTSIFDGHESISDEEILKYLTPKLSKRPKKEHFCTSQYIDYFEDLLSDSESYIEDAFLNTQGIIKLLKGRRINRNRPQEITSSKSCSSYKKLQMSTDQCSNLIEMKEDKVIDNYICNVENL